MKRFFKPAATAAWLLTALLAAALAGCAARGAVLADPTAPPAGYQRRIMLVVETNDFRPVAGAAVTIEPEPPTKLVSPSGGVGRTDEHGGLLLVFEPPPHYDEAVLTGGDVVVDFPIKAKITVDRGRQPKVTRVLMDRETFARYADPLYQGLDRDPESGLTYYNIMLP